MRVLSIALFAAAVFLPVGSAASGQSLLVHVTEAETGRPLPGAFVSVLDRAGVVLRSALTDDAGQARFHISDRVAIAVKAEMIGRATRVSSPLSSNERLSGRVDLALSHHAIALAEIRVDVDERCHLRPDDALEIARVWESVRTSLSVQAWTQQEGVYRLDIATYERDLDRSGRRVERESRTTKSRVTRAPFRSMAPEELVTTGFIRSLEDGGHEYYGPDAVLLLSDEFLDTHCFRLTRSADHPGSVGLAFEPLAETDRPDITGTLWLDDESGYLRFLEYRYTSVPVEEARGLAGGRVEFEAMPNGAWIIRKWWIRAPMLGRFANLARSGDTGIRVTGMRETGGEVTAVSTAARQLIARMERGVIRGTVWDSTRSAALPGASIYLSGTADSTTADGDGVFLLENLRPGLFTAELRHPRLDSLGIASPVVEIDVVEGDTAELVLAIPSSASIILSACRAEQVDREGSDGVLAGSVNDQTGGDPMIGASVRVEWQEIERTAPPIRITNRWLDVRTDTSGRYTACGVPIDASLRVHASLLSYRSDVATAVIPVSGYATLDLSVTLPDGRSSHANDRRGNVATEQGSQGIQGTLVDRESGSPIAAAEVVVRRMSGEVVATGLTNDRGFFRLQTRAPGRYLLGAETLGYHSLAGSAVEVVMGRLAHLEISLVPAALELDPLVVAAESRAFHLEMEGFYRRQSDGLGAFITPEILERRNPRLVSDVLFGQPGVNVAEPTTGRGGRAVYFRAGERARGICWPMVYINRQLVSTGGLSDAEPAAVDELVHAADIAAVEVYRSPAEVPPEFSGPNAGCGVIVLWTRKGGS